jgi:SAM-dependent methyltransferase
MSHWRATARPLTLPTRSFNLAALPSPRIIQGVLDLVADIAPDHLNVLDVSCKRGDLLRLLAARGFKVRGTNYESEPAAIDGIPIDGGVDLTDGLPFPDGSFDLVFLTEVIEHLENHKAAIFNLARVAKPGGRLIITTPNIMRLDSRLAFLLSGLHKTKRRQMPLDTPLAGMHRFHNFPIAFPILYYLLRQNGFEIERIGHSETKTIAYLLYGLMYPFVAANTAFRLIHRERRNPGWEPNRAMMRWMLDRRMLMEDTLLIRAKKTPTPAS